MDRLKNKTAIVTGGALGIGRATCMLMAREGARVALTDVLEDEGYAAVKKISDAGGVAEYWRLDVAVEDEVQEVFGKINARFGRIDVLVNNAGISGANKPTHELTEAEWDKVMSVNVKGGFFCTKHVVPYMKAAGGGSIVNLSSIYGLVGAGDSPAYHASKGAVRLMSKNDAILYAPFQIRVNSVHPAFIWTPMVQQYVRELRGELDQIQKEMIARHPIGRVGVPEDVAWGIIYLASDEAGFVTGSELVIDGGYTAQ